jgi:uncharacterized membrane protein
MNSILELNQDPLWPTLLRFLVTLTVLTIIIRFIYSPHTRRKRNEFSFYLMGIMIFMVCILLQHVEIQLGVALGLFAVFAIMRFRSENLRLREMSYFFTVIGVSVINAMATFYNPVRGTILINLVIILSIFILEKIYWKKPKKSFDRAVLLYDKLELLEKERYSELIADISLRTRKKIEKVEIRKIDLLKNTVELDIFF